MHLRYFLKVKVQNLGYFLGGEGQVLGPSLRMQKK